MKGASEAGPGRPYGSHDVFQALVFFLILCSTWVTTSIPVSFSTSGLSVVWAYDFISIGIAVFVFREWRRGGLRLRDPLNAALLVCAAALFLFYAASTAYRIAMKQSVSGNFLVTRVTLMSLMSYFLLRSRRVSAKAAFTGILAWVSVLNTMQLISMLAYRIPPRHSLILANINIYDAFATMVVPLAAYAWSESGRWERPFRAVVRWALGLNYLVAMNIVVFSGSRLAFVLYLAVSLVSLFVIKPGKLSAAGLFKYLSVPLVLAVWFGGLLFLNLPLVSEGIYRSLYYPIQVAGKILNAPEWKDPAWLTPSEPAEDGDSKTVGETVDISNDLRSMIHQKAISEIQANPLTGTGRPDVLMGERGYQSAHNFLLEYALCYGIPGAALCVVLIFLPLYFILFRYGLPMKAKVTVLSLYAVTLAFSFFQPLITTKYIIGVSFWMMAAMIARLRPENGRPADLPGRRRRLG